jgi:penicillin-binding protein 1C
VTARVAKKYLRLMAIIFSAGLLAQSPTFLTTKNAFLGSDGVLLDRHGEIIQERRIENTARRLGWVTLDQISPAFIAALLRAEDKRFWTHGGVDFTAVAVVLLRGLSGQKLRGASTLSMQLAGLLEKKTPGHGGKKSAWSKWAQMRKAWALERAWTKQEILEAYVNLVTFRGELQGIEAASKAFFEKAPHALLFPEATLLAALLRSPNSNSTLVAQRACRLAVTLEKPLECEAISRLARKMFSSPYVIRPSIRLAPQVADILFPICSGPSSRNTAECNSRKIISTLEADLQRFAAETLVRTINGLVSQNVKDGAILVVDNQTAEILAYVGNSGFRSSAPFVDGVTAQRQAGSILKPFIYGLALENRLLTTSSKIDDSSLDVPVSGGVYRPKNYDGNFHGMVSLRTALASSLNVPAVKTLALVGIQNVLNLLSRLEFKNLREANYYGPSLALGSADVSLAQVVAAYRALAAKGFWQPLILSGHRRETSARAKTRIFDEATTFLLSDILSDRQARSLTFGLDNPLATRFWTAAKTGTSKDMRDNWCVGFSQRYTVGVWIGNFSGEPMWSLSGITGAAPIWREVMNRLHKNEPSVAPQWPENIAYLPATDDSGFQRRGEYFIKGTEPAIIPPAGSVHTRTEIRYPPPGMIFALDPDIPPDRQRVFFDAGRSADVNLSWVLNGSFFGTVGSGLSWRPIRGKHELHLVDTGHKILDRINFEVR